MGVVEVKHGESYPEACRCACPDGIAPSQISANADACDDLFVISAVSESDKLQAPVYDILPSFGGRCRKAMLGVCESDSVVSTIVSVHD